MRLDVFRKHVAPKVGRFNAEEALRRFNKWTAPDGDPNSSTLNDVFQYFKAGATEAIADIATVPTLGSPNVVSQGLRNKAEDWRMSASPSAIQAYNNFGIEWDEGQGPSFKEGSSLYGLALHGFGGLGSTVPMLATGGSVGLLSRSSTALNRAIKVQKAAVKANNASRANKALAMANNLQKRLDAQRFAAQTGVMGAMIGGSSGNQAYETVMQATVGELQASPKYQEYVQQMTPQQAREALANDAAASATGGGVLLGAASGGYYGKFLDKAIKGKLASGAKTRMGALGRGTAAGFAGESLQEGVEEGGQQLVSNLAVGREGLPVDPMDNVKAAAATGALIGGVTGGAMAAPGSLYRGADKKPTVDSATATVNNRQEALADIERRLQGDLSAEDRVELETQREKILREVADSQAVKEQAQEQQQANSEGSDIAESEASWVDTDIDEKIMELSTGISQLEQKLRRAGRAGASANDVQYLERALEKNRAVLKRLHALDYNRDKQHFFQNREEFYQWIDKTIGTDEEQRQAERELTHRQTRQQPGGNFPTVVPGQQPQRSFIDELPPELQLGMRGVLADEAYQEAMATIPTKEEIEEEQQELDRRERAERIMGNAKQLLGAHRRQQQFEQMGKDYEQQASAKQGMAQQKPEKGSVKQGQQAPTATDERTLPGTQPPGFSGKQQQRNALTDLARRLNDSDKPENRDIAKQLRGPIDAISTGGSYTYTVDGNTLTVSYGKSDLKEFNRFFQAIAKRVPKSETRRKNLLNTAARMIADIGRRYQGGQDAISKELVKKTKKVVAALSEQRDLTLHYGDSVLIIEDGQVPARELKAFRQWLEGPANTNGNYWKNYLNEIKKSMPDGQRNEQTIALEQMIRNIEQQNTQKTGYNYPDTRQVSFVRGEPDHNQMVDFLRWLKPGKVAPPVEKTAKKGPDLASQLVKEAATRKRIKEETAARRRARAEEQQKELEKADREVAKEDAAKAAQRRQQENYQQRKRREKKASDDARARQSRQETIDELRKKDSGSSFYDIATHIWTNPETGEKVPVIYEGNDIYPGIDLYIDEKGKEITGYKSQFEPTKNKNVVAEKETARQKKNEELNKIMWQDQEEEQRKQRQLTEDEQHRRDAQKQEEEAAIEKKQKELQAKEEEFNRIMEEKIKKDTEKLKQEKEELDKVYKELESGMKKRSAEQRKKDTGGEEGPAKLSWKRSRLVNANIIGNSKGKGFNKEYKAKSALSLKQLEDTHFVFKTFHGDFFLKRKEQLEPTTTTPPNTKPITKPILPKKYGSMERAPKVEEASVQEDELPDVHRKPENLNTSGESVKKIKKSIQDNEATDNSGLDHVKEIIDHWEEQAPAAPVSNAPEHENVEPGKALDVNTVYPRDEQKPTYQDVDSIDDSILPLTMTAEDFGEVTMEWHSLLAEPDAKVITGQRVKGKDYISNEEADNIIQEWKNNAYNQSQDPDTEKENSKKTILSFFDYSGSWSRPWKEAGYNVIQFDIQNGQDVMDFNAQYFIDNYDIGDVYGILAACPCTDFANSGARHFAAKDKDGRTEASKELVFQTMRTIEFFRPKFWALENPVGRIKKLTNIPDARLTFDPHHFGNPYTKKTLLYGKFDPNLPLANVNPIEGSKIHQKYGGKSLKTKNARSKTPEGFAYAFFMANNYADLDPKERLILDFPEISGAVGKAFDSGLTEEEVREIVERRYEDSEYIQARNDLIKAVKDKMEKGISILETPGSESPDLNLSSYTEQELAQQAADQQAQQGEESQKEKAATTDTNNKGSAKSYTINLPVYGELTFNVVNQPRLEEGETLIQSEILTGPFKIMKWGQNPGGLPDTINAWRISTIKKPDGSIYARAEYSEDDKSFQTYFTALDSTMQSELHRINKSVEKALNTQFDNHKKKAVKDKMEQQPATDLELVSYTESDLEQQAAEQKAQQREENNQAKAERDKAHADRDVDDFTLTGSNSSADLANAHGQSDLLPPQRPWLDSNDGDQNAEELRNHRDSAFQQVGDSYFRLQSRGPITTEQAKIIRHYFGGEEGMNRLEAIAKNNPTASQQDLMNIIMDQAGIPVTDGKISRTGIGKIQFDTRFVLVEADDLITSHSPSGSVNPDYPQHMQPRDRSKASTLIQQQEIIDDFNPAMLEHSPKAGDGAPIINTDKQVESGNGRINILRKIYQSRPDLVKSYQDYLRGKAQDLGIDASRLDTMKNPVLIRVRLGTMDEKTLKKYLEDANNPQDIMGLSPTEQAKVDAGRIEPQDMDLFDTGSSGNVLAKSNYPFLNTFYKRISGNPNVLQTTNQAGDTIWSDAMAQRVLAAVFHKAYGNDRLTAIFAELSPADRAGMANIVHALNKSAGTFAKVRAQYGGLQDLDIVTPLVESIEIIQQAKRDNQSVTEALSQQNMLNPWHPMTDRLTRFIDANMRKKAALADMLTSLANAIDNELRMREHSQNDMLGGFTPSDLDSILAREQAANEKNEEKPTVPDTGRPVSTSGKAGKPGKTTKGKADTAREETIDTSEQPAEFTVNDNTGSIERNNAPLKKTRKSALQALLREEINNNRLPGKLKDYRLFIPDGQKMWQAQYLGKPEEPSAPAFDPMAFSNTEGDLSTLTVENLKAIEASQQYGLAAIGRRIGLMGGMDAEGLHQKIQEHLALVSKIPVQIKAKLLQRLDVDVFDNKIPYRDIDDKLLADLRKVLPDIYFEQHHQKLNLSYIAREIQLEAESNPTIKYFQPDQDLAPAPEPEPPVTEVKKRRLKRRERRAVLTEEEKQLNKELANAFKSLGSAPSSNIGYALEKIFPIAVRMGSVYVQKGYLTFRDWADNMLYGLDDEGVDVDIVLPHLKSIYAATKQNATDDQYAQMDSEDSVRSFDLESLFEEEPDLVTESVKEETNLPPQADPNSLAQDIYQYLKTGETINDNNRLKKFIADRDGITTNHVTEPMMKEAQEALELGMVMMARDTVSSGLDEQSIYDELVRQYNNMPVLDARSSTSMENQAYSTPAPMAFIASQLAGITQQSTAYDPTTGNGMLLIGTTVDNATSNEINDDRANNLRQLGYEPTQNDAQTFVPDQLFDAIITNPPFGPLKQTIKYDGYNFRKLDYLIPAKALESMKDDGRAVIIIGANDVRKPGIIGESDRIFFNWLYSRYNVVDHFEADGSLYKRQGAGWPVRIITIDGRKRSNTLSPRSGTIKRLDNWNAIYDHYQSVMDTLRQSQQERESLSERENETGSPEPTDVDRPTLDQITRRGSSRRSGSRGNANTGSTVNRAGTDRDTSGGHTGQPAKQPAGNNATEQDRLPEPRNKGRQRNTAEQGTEPDRPTGNTGQPKLSASEFQDNYSPASNGSNDAVLTPKTMASRIMQALENMVAEIGDVDQYVMEKLGYDSVDDVLDVFMGLQIDAIAAAIYNHEKRNKGIIIADQTGVGKGRQAAGIIRYAERIGKIPIFVTVKPNLFTDMYNDLKDINTPHIKPFILNREAVIKQMDEDGNPLPDLFANKQSRTVDGVKIDEHRDTILEIIETGKLPADRNALFMTYSQIKDNNIQRRLIEALGDKAFFVLDESHNAAGDFTARVKGGGKRKTTAGFFADVLQNASVTYLSATYAKRPDNMAIYFRTDLIDAVDNFSELIEAVETGGLPLQTVISAMLAESGQLFRRERSFEGIEIKTQVNYADSDAHRQLFDKVTEGLRAVVDADQIFKEYFVDWAKENAEDLGMRIRAAGNMAAASVDHQNFTSIVHNYISQILMAMKADGVVEKSLQLVQDGKKPVIATDNTMESFINKMIEKHNLKPGDPFPFDYRDILLSALERTRRISLKDTAGNSEPIQVELDELDGITRQAYENAEQIIRSLDLSGLPVSPIDYIKQKLSENGIDTGEITGRKTIIDYSGDVPRVGKRPANEKKQRRTTVDNFNSGKLIAIILNQAGSTGLSIHASEKFNNKDPRHMLVMQASLDINTVMQMLGRINRTGQVAIPEFTLMALDLPAEKRPFAILSQKLLSLNAQTSANSDSDVSIKAPNILNKYGDKIVNNYLLENRNLASRLNISVTTDEDREPPQGIAKTFTGRLSLLSVEQQEDALAAVEADYLALIDYLDKTGQNDLNPRTVDLDAKILESDIIYTGKESSSLFGGNTTMHKVDVRYQGKPPTANDVKKAINKSLDGQSIQEFTDQLISKKEKDGELYNENLGALFRNYKKQVEDEFKKDKLKKFADPNNINLPFAEQLLNVIQFLNNSNNFGPTHKVTKKYNELLKKMENFEFTIGSYNSQKAKNEQLLNDKFKIGNHFELSIAGEKMIGIVTRVQDAHVTGRGNPYAESKTRITFMVNDGIRQITLPLSQINNTPELIEKKLPTTGTDSLDALFDTTQSTRDRREDRYIATGNLISGISQLHSDGGRIISFTGNDGKTYQGILMPKRYRSTTSATNVAPVILRDPAKIVRFLRDNRDNHLIRGYGLRNKDGKIALSSDGSRWVLQLPKSNRDATVKLVKFDDDLRLVMGGDFFSRGKNMFARFDDSNLPGVVERLLQLTNLNALGSMKPQLEAAGFNVNQQAVKSFDGSENDANVDTTYTKPVETPTNTPVNTEQDVITFVSDGGKSTTFTIMDSEHSQKKEPLYVVNMDGNLNKDEYATVNAMAKSNNGYYIKAGLRRYYTPLPGTTATGTPTFTFPTKSDRDNFLASLRGKANSAEPEVANAIQGYSNDHPEWATNYEKYSVGSKIIYSDDEYALIEGYSLISGKPVYPLIIKKEGKTRVDITSYTGNLDAQTRQRLEAVRQQHIDREQAKYEQNPNGPFTDNQQVVGGSNITGSLLNTAKGWLATLGITDRVFISDTFSDTVKATEQYNLYGEYAAIRHASDENSAESGYLRTLPNGDHFIMLKTQGKSNESILATLAHEIGHIVEKTAYKNADKETKRAINDAFIEWLNEHQPNIQQPGSAKELIESLRHPANSDVVGLTDTMKADELNLSYWSSFNEWFADNVARWALTSKKPKSVVEKFFKMVAEKLRQLYATLIGRKYLPNKVLADYLDSLTPPDFNVESVIGPTQTPYQLVKSMRTANPGDVQYQLNTLINNNNATINELKKSGSDKAHSVGEFARKNGLGFLSGKQIAEIYSPIFKSVENTVGHNPLQMLDKLLQKMTSDRSNWAHRAEKIDQRWSKLARKNPDNYNRLSNLMHKSTLYQIDPRQPIFTTKSGRTFDSLKKIISDATSDKQKRKFERELAEETKRLKHYNEVRPMWLALNSEPEAQRLYNDVEKYYLDQYKSLQKALQERIDSMDLDPESRKGIRHQLNAMFQKALAGPYFPLMRFGDYVITAKDKDGNHYRAHYETATAREAAETQLEKDGYTITFTGMRDQFDPRNLAGVPEFSAKIRRLLGVSKIKDIENNPQALQLLSQINQITLEMLPEMSSAKRGMHRKGIPGYHENARRAFDATSLTQANRIGKVRYGWQMENELNQIKNIANQENNKSPLTARQRDTAKHVYNEMSKRHELIMNPNGSPIAAALTNLGFIWYMGASAGAGIINLTQNLLIALPQLGAQYGFIKTAKIMKQVFVDYMKGYSKPTSLDDALQNSWFSLENSTIPADEKALIQQLINDGTIETTQAHVLAQMADTDIRPEDIKRRDWQTKITRASGIFFHNAEVANRQIAALTAYRLAKANNKITLTNGKPDEATVDKIRQAVFDAHFDYSATNRPRYFKSNWAKVLLLFKQFSQNTAFLLSRNFYQAIKGESKEVKDQARKTLLGIMAMQTLFAGTLGLPLASSILTMAGMALGDEDDPVDAEATVRQYFSDLFGKELGHALSKGVFNSFFNMDLHSRTSLSDLFFRGASYDMSPRQEAQYAISNTLAGPIGALTVNMWAGLNEVASGDPWRGMETMAPKFIRDAMKSYRYSTEGVQNRQGQTIIEEFNITEKLAQFAGISPARLSEAYDASNAVTGLREKIQYRRSRLLDALDKAKTTGEQRSARQQIQAFNDVQRERKRNWAIINNDTIKRSLTGKEKRRQQSKYGIYLSDAQFGMMDMARFADL